MSDTDKLIAEIRSWVASVHDPIETYPNTLLIAAADALEASRTPAAEFGDVVFAAAPILNNRCTPVTPAEGEAEEREALHRALMTSNALLRVLTASPELLDVEATVEHILAAGFSRRSPVGTEENWEYRALAHFKDGQVADLVEFKSREAALTYAMKSNETEPRPNIVDGDDIEVMWIAEERKVFSTRPNPWLPVTEEKK